MNDKDWNEFWDDDQAGENDCNDFGNDIDANNDETFDNAAEWNEDEHEELIARDSILSQSIKRNNNNHSRSNNDRSSNSTINNPNSIHTEDLPFLKDAQNSQNNTGDHGLNSMSSILGTASRGGWNAMHERISSPGLGKVNSHQHYQSTSSDLTWHNIQDSAERIQALKIQQQQLLVQKQLLEHQQQQQLRAMQILQQQRILQQQELLQQQQLQHQRQQQQQREKLGFDVEFALRQGLSQADSRPNVLRVDELERQLFNTRINNQQSEAANLSQRMRKIDVTGRSGWSPFGSKDLFVKPEDVAVYAQMEQPWPREVPFEHRSPEKCSPQLENMDRQSRSRLAPNPPQCFTVEELERQMLSERLNESAQANLSTKPRDSVQQKDLSNRQSGFEEDTVKVNDSNNGRHEYERRNNDRHDHDRRDQERRDHERRDHERRDHERRDNERRDHERRDNERRDNERRDNERRDRFDRHDREGRGNREPREHRDHGNHRSIRDIRFRGKKQLIIPPQAQLSVIEKAKGLHQISTKHPDEFIQDKMPTPEDGFLFRRHQIAKKNRALHNGVLTQNDRNRLINMQKKIQADYDDNWEQDYYYLLYFNRSSMTDEAAMKPCGPGVLDKRFIPRERLLYNTST